MIRIRQRANNSKNERSSRIGKRHPRGLTDATSIFILLLMLGSLAAAQATSSLNGSVTDPSGATVAGATITLTDTDTGLQRSTSSNNAGLYQFLDVPPGKYRLEAAGKGFAAFLVENVTLVVKTPSTVNIRFRLAGVAESVTVQAEAPLINRTDASLGNTLEQTQIAQLPIPDRNVVTLLSLQPGVAYLGNQSQSLQDSDTRSVRGRRA